MRRAHTTVDNANMYAMFAMTMLVKNRISFKHLNEEEYERREAVTIPAASFLPGESDWGRLRDRMKILVARILVEHIPALQNNRNIVEWHIPHEFSNESNKKSEVVSLMS